MQRSMIRIPGGAFSMGSTDFYPEEQPPLATTVEPFWMDEHPVTVAAFRRFVKATGYVTVAERAPDAADYPEVDPADLVPGALVFRMTPGPVCLDDYQQWWSYVPGADWRHPLGPSSTLNGRELHPVTQIAHEDVLAYAAWCGKSLPTETTSAPRAGGWPIPGMASSRGSTSPARVGWLGPAPRRCAPSRRTDTGSSTSPGTCGNGLPIPTLIGARKAPRRRAALRRLPTPASSPPSGSPGA
jgi:hypothetical protein